ncbi:hypothetical protein SCAR479_00183 [Seiridium cardinale]|uniref:Rhodopsin domain-containing protein n=1 Tax=Seiridium cardinale TaxID=138064 RepID=A0ABR2Y8S5_9PEZI
MESGIFSRRPDDGVDVTKIPTPPLQVAALFINFFFPASALILVVLRGYSRIRMQQLGLDDYLLFLAMLCSLLMCGPFYLYIKLNYWGWHTADVPEFDPAPGLWWFFLAQLFYNPVLALVKASVLWFLLRLGGPKSGVWWAIYALGTFNALQAIAIFLVALLQCLPIEANWDTELKATARCVQPSFHITISCLTLFTDVLVLVIPFWIFLGLKMPLAARLAVIGVFLTGLIVVVVGIVRLVNVYKLFYITPAAGADVHYDISLTLNVVEINLAIMSATVPALRSIFIRCIPGLGRSSGGNRKYISNGDNYRRDGLYARDPVRSGAHHSDADETGNKNGVIALKNLQARLGKGQRIEIRSTSPTGSQEDLMTYNGIMRTTDVRVHYDRDK